MLCIADYSVLTINSKVLCVRAMREMHENLRVIPTRTCGFDNLPIKYTSKPASGKYIAIPGIQFLVVYQLLEVTS